MNPSARLLALAGALMSLTVVVLAAMGSHMIDMRGLQSAWQTALKIHMFNAAAILGLAALLANTQTRLLKWGSWLIVAGSFCFCSIIFLHVVAGYVFSGVTPAGGMIMMAGWLLVVLNFVHKS